MSYTLPFMRSIKTLTRPKGLAVHPRPAAGIAHVARPRSPIHLAGGGGVGVSAGDMPAPPDIPVGVSQDDPLAALFQNTPGFGLPNNQLPKAQGDPLQNPWLTAGLGALAGATGAAGANYMNNGRPTPIMSRSQDNPFPIPQISRTTDPVTQVVTQHVLGYKPWGATQKMAAGGPVMPGGLPVGMQSPGQSTGVQSELQKRQVFMAAVQALQGKSPDPQAALKAFVAKFGPQALQELAQHLQAGQQQQQMQMQQPRPAPQQAPMAGGGIVQGGGDGTSDSVSAVHTPTGAPIQLSDGEYVIPSDAVSSLGNGSSKAGAKKLDAGIRKLRAKKRSGGIRGNPPNIRSDENPILGS